MKAQSYADHNQESTTPNGFQVIVEIADDLNVSKEKAHREYFFL
jgi:hypothetical protein